jgi:hypothetical protein
MSVAATCVPQVDGHCRALSHVLHSSPPQMVDGSPGLMAFPLFRPGRSAAL